MVENEQVPRVASGQNQEALGALGSSFPFQHAQVGKVKLTIGAAFLGARTRYKIQDKHHRCESNI